MSPLTTFCFFIIIQIDSLWLIVRLLKDNKTRVWCLRQRLKLENHQSFVKNLRRLTLSAPLPHPQSPYISKVVIQLVVYSLIGLSRLRLATFEHLLRLGASFCDSNNHEQFVPFWAIFLNKIGVKHISSAKKPTISLKTLRILWFRLSECNQ